MLLHRLDFVYKQTTNIPSKYDAQVQKDFKDFYEDLEANLPKNQAIVFIDATHPQHNTQPTQVWAKKGQEKIIKSNTGRQRININGAYNPLTQDFIHETPKIVNSEAVISLLKKIEDFYPRKEIINVFADNAPVIKSNAVFEYLQSSKINLIFIPTYSPNLNLIERFWKYLRKEIIRTTYYDAFKAFKLAIIGFLDNSKNFKPQLKKSIGTKLHLLPNQAA